VEQKGVRLSKNAGLTVETVAPGSIGEEVGVQVGDRLISMNGREIKDVLDFRFVEGEEELLLELAKPNGEVWEVEVEKDLDEALGIDFPEMKIRSCPNKCFFCFVDQMPAGQRETLYVRDEDYRFSFLFGNYITLTNLTRKDKERIFEQKMSPLYVSVHTTDLELRRAMLVNPRARDVMAEIREMAEHGIVLHTQIVLCPGINDGDSLTKSIEDLVKFYPSVGSLAIVPIGLTRHRQGLPELKEVTVEGARERVAWIRPWQKRFREEIGYPFVFLADEWYTKAGLPFPPLEEYADLPQQGNGVGIVPLFLSDFEAMLPFLPEKISDGLGNGAATSSLENGTATRPIQILMATGTSFSPFLSSCIGRVRMWGAELDVVTVVNDFFGDSVTVAGLMSGRDILRAVRPRVSDRSGSRILLLPSVALNEDRSLFLDGMTPQDLEKELDLTVQVVSADAEGLMGFLQNIPVSQYR
jgi:putative radical SAM enzyme (TIGR03279 family)